MTPKQLVQRWQKRLGLQAWHISVHVKPWHECDGNLGTCTAHEELRTAVVELMCPDDVPPGRLTDLEHTVVHELLHIVFACVAPDPRDEWRAVAFEQALNVTASALIDSFDTPSRKP